MPPKKRPLFGTNLKPRKPGPYPPFSLFLKERRQKILEENKETHRTEVYKQISESWNALTEEEREDYKTRAIEVTNQRIREWARKRQEMDDALEIRRQAALVAKKEAAAKKESDSKKEAASKKESTSKKKSSSKKPPRAIGTVRIEALRARKMLEKFIDKQKSNYLDRLRIQRRQKRLSQQQQEMVQITVTPEFHVPNLQNSKTGLISRVKLCRICGRARPQHFMLRDKPETIQDIKFVLGLDIDLQNDMAEGFPDSICLKCDTVLTNYSSYKKTVDSGQAKLRQQDIKQESESSFEASILPDQESGFEYADNPYYHPQDEDEFENNQLNRDSKSSENNDDDIIDPLMFLQMSSGAIDDDENSDDLDFDQQVEDGANGHDDGSSTDLSKTVEVIVKEEIVESLDYQEVDKAKSYGDKSSTDLNKTIEVIVKEEIVESVDYQEVDKANGCDDELSTDLNKPLEVIVKEETEVNLYPQDEYTKRRSTDPSVRIEDTVQDDDPMDGVEKVNHLDVDPRIQSDFQGLEEGDSAACN